MRYFLPVIKKLTLIILIFIRIEFLEQNRTFFFNVNFQPHRRRDSTTGFPCTVCPRSSDPFYIVTYCIKWVNTSLVQL